MIQMRTFNKDKFIFIYSLYIKKNVDAFVAHSSTHDYVEAILDDLFEEYDNFVTFVLFRVDSYTVETEALLLSQEEIFDKYKTSKHYIIQVNYALGSWSSQHQ